MPPDLRDLSPTSARLCLLVEKFLRAQRLVGGLLAAVSGGADSLALALVLGVLAPRLKTPVFAVTVDHGLLPDSKAVAAAAARQCVRLGLDCVCRKVDVSAFAAEKRLGIEEAGRELRYAALEEERKARGAAFIALGHHKADLAEDALMRFTRGAGWPALAGMPARDERRRLLRPFLLIQPQALKSLLLECRIAWFEDPANRDLRFKRNRMRHTVLPLLCEENPSFDSGVARLWRLAQTDRDYWDSVLTETFKRARRLDGGLLLPAALLRGLHAAVRLRLYHRSFSLLADVAKTPGQPKTDALLALDAAFAQKRGNTRFQLSGGLEAKVGRQGILFYRT